MNLADAVKPDMSVRLITGPMRSGKTTHLVGRIAELTDGGEDPSRIAAVCASPQGARALRRRLTDAGLDATVIDVASLGMSVLADPIAFSFTGRRPRLLLPYERRFLFEDMKVTGVKEKRLREMMKFFERMWTELADDDPSWLMEGEESIIHARLKSVLAFSEGLLDTEVSNLAVRFLTRHPEVRDRYSCDHMLVDDYGALSRASQILCASLADESLTAACDDRRIDEAYERFPYPEGMLELRESFPASEEVRLSTHASDPLARIVDALLAAKAPGPMGLDDGNPDAQPSLVPVDPVCSGCGDATQPVAESANGHEGESTRGARSAVATRDAFAPSVSHETENAASCGGCDAVVIRTAETPQAELSVVTEEISRLIAEGTDPGDVAAVCFGRTDMRRVVQALREGGIPAIAPETSALDGEVGDPRSCGLPRICALLSLVADPDCASAWRAMGGFGDTLGASLGFDTILTFAEERDLTLADALKTLSEDASGLSGEGKAAAESIVARYKAVMPVVQRLRPLAGEHLVETAIAATFGDASSPDARRFRALIGEVFPEDDAAALLDRMRRRAAEGIGDAKAVRVTDAKALTGMECSHLIVMGCVNGYTPRRLYFDKTAVTQTEAETMWNRDALRWYALAGVPRDGAVFTTFSRMDPEEAQRAGVHVERIKFENGRRTCVIGPSDYLRLFS